MNINIWWSCHPSVIQNQLWELSLNEGAVDYDVIYLIDLIQSILVSKYIQLLLLWQK